VRVGRGCMLAESRWTGLKKSLGTGCKRVVTAGRACLLAGLCGDADAVARIRRRGRQCRVVKVRRSPRVGVVVVVVEDAEAKRPTVRTGSGGARPRRSGSRELAAFLALAVPSGDDWLFALTRAGHLSIYPCVHASVSMYPSVYLEVGCARGRRCSCCR
jgi:hypothetical protein